MTTTTLADLTTKLVELESHPGLEHLRLYAPAGTTAQHWAVLEPALGRLWDDLAELKELSDTDELADRLTRSHAEYKEIKAFVDAVDDINTLVATRVSQSLKQLDAVGTAVPEEITDLLAVSATDPLSLTTDDIERRSAAIAELVALVVNWPDAVTTTSKQPGRVARRNRRSGAHPGARRAGRADRPAAACRRRRADAARRAGFDDDGRSCRASTVAATASSRHCNVSAPTNNWRRACSTAAPNSPDA